MNGRAERETFIGHEAQHMRGVLALKHPIKNGIIQNWDEMEKVRGTFLLMCIHVSPSTPRIPKDQWYNWIFRFGITHSCKCAWIQKITRSC